MYATGLTDGWFDFMTAFEKTLKDNQSSFSNGEKHIAEDLLSKLKKHLADR